tara:strand:- start:15083 stop:15628 length:546 start_codon:yes stop_codon:yes gene_type:complete
MKYLLIFITFFLLYSCSNNKGVYWCGDHACVDNKERKEYFKKNMTVEIKKTNKNKKKKLSQVELIKKKSGLYDKKSKKMEKEERLLTKKLELEEKKRIKEQKKLAKKKLIEERKKLKKEKKMSKKNKSKLNKQENINIDKKISLDKKSVDRSNDEFNTLIQKILKKNKSKSYPDINAINIE